MEVKHNEKSEMHREDKAFTDWLESISKPSYQQGRRDTFLIFLDYLREKEGWENPTGDKVLQKHVENRKSDDKKAKFYFDDLLPKFVDWLKEERGVSHNSAVSLSTHVRGFFAYHRDPLKIRKGKIQRIEKAKRYHVFKQSELRDMVRVANVEEKPVILLGKDEGLRVGDFVSQKREPILEAYTDSSGEFPLEFEIETEKEGIVAVAHLMQETWTALLDYWKTVPESEYVFPSNGGYISDDTANYAIKETWKRAYPDRQETKVRFHELRSFKMTCLSNAGVNTSCIKKMVGKKLSEDLATYLKGEDLRKAFMKAENQLRLTEMLSTSNHETIAQLKEDLAEMALRLEKTERLNKILIERLEKSQNPELRQIATDLKELRL